MCRVATAEYQAVPSAAGQARHRVAERLRWWGLPELVEPATLLTSELVANAVVHAGEGAVGLTVAVADTTLEVGVTDRKHRLPRALRPGRASPADLGEHALMAEGGRGLLLVDAIAEEWGATGLAGGKQVWFRLAVANWSHRSECRCHGDEIDRVRLDSGRYVLALPGPWDDPVAD